MLFVVPFMIIINGMLRDCSNDLSDYRKFKPVFISHKLEKVLNGHPLLSLHPNLSSHDILLCDLLAKQTNTPKIAKMLNITIASVYSARYRIRTKLNLEKNINLVNYLRQFTFYKE